MSPFRLAYVPYEVRFKRPLVTGRAVYSHREGWWVAVRDMDGHVGFGEVAPLPAFGGESHEAAARTLATLAAAPLDAPDAPDLDALAIALSRAGLDRDATPAVHAGIELALLDALTARAGQPLAQALAPAPASCAPLQRLLSATTPAETLDQAAQALGEGFATLKLKVGAAPLADDLARVAALRAAFPEVTLRLDANGAWSQPEAIAAIEALALYRIDLLEQPVAGSEFAALRGRGIAIAADEALLDARIARRLVEDAAVDALVLKPMLMGGLGIARSLAQAAALQGIRTVVTSSLDRVVGVAAALQLACSLPRPEAAGLSTLALLDAPDADGPLRSETGMMQRPDAPGLGVFPPDDARDTLMRRLERC